MDHPKINPKTYFRPRTFSLVGRDVPADRLDYLLWESEAYTGSSIQADMSAYITGDSRDLTGSITCPMLMVRGQDDWMVTDEMVESTISRLPAETPVTLVRPEGLGHFAHVEQPETVADIVRSFLEDLVAS